MLETHAEVEGAVRCAGVLRCGELWEILEGDGDDGGRTDSSSIIGSVWHAVCWTTPGDIPKGSGDAASSLDTCSGNAMDFSRSEEVGVDRTDHSGDVDLSCTLEGDADLADKSVGGKCRFKEVADERADWDIELSGDRDTLEGKVDAETAGPVGVGGDAPTDKGGNRVS